jgi:hypothetical protein
MLRFLHHGEEQRVHGRFDRLAAGRRRRYRWEAGTTDVESRAQAHGAGNAGYRAYTVKAGDCIANIAFRYGMFPGTLWDDSKNRELREKRRDPNVLLPGDVVYLRAKELKEVSGGAEERHRFRRKGVPEMLRLQFSHADGTPRAGEPYVLNIDGSLISSTTDGDGYVIQPIPPKAREAVLLLGAEQDEFVFDLGDLDPVEEISGVQGRLENLGFYDGPIDGLLTADTTQAIAAFQASKGIAATGEADQRTQDALREAYGG